MVSWTGYFYKQRQEPSWSRMPGRSVSGDPGTIFSPGYSPPRKYPYYLNRGIYREFIPAASAWWGTEISLISTEPSTVYRMPTVIA